MVSSYPIHRPASPAAPSSRVSHSPYDQLPQLPSSAVPRSSLSPSSLCALPSRPPDARQAHPRSGQPWSRALRLGPHPLFAPAAVSRIRCQALGHSQTHAHGRSWRQCSSIHSPPLRSNLTHLHRSSRVTQLVIGTNSAGCNADASGGCWLVQGHNRCC